VTTRNLLFATGIAALLLAAALGAYPSSTELAPSNPAWNGLSQAVRAFHMHALSSLGELPRTAAGTALVIIPARPVSGRDIGVLRRYLDDGGLVLVLADSGPGNDLLARLGIPVRLAAGTVEDPLFAYKNRRFPRIAEVMGPASEGVRALILNHPTALLVTGPLEVLAQSSLVSYLDTDGNHRQDPGEPSGPFAVAAAASVGSGTLVVVADSSLLTNAMLPLGDNRRFLRNLLALPGSGARVYLDTAHLPHAPLDVAKDLLDQARKMVAFPPLTFALVASGVLVFWGRLGISRRR
jgi:hypothetical protein